MISPVKKKKKEREREPSIVLKWYRKRKKKKGGRGRRGGSHFANLVEVLLTVDFGVIPAPLCDVIHSRTVIRGNKPRGVGYVNWRKFACSSLLHCRDRMHDNKLWSCKSANWCVHMKMRFDTLIGKVLDRPLLLKNVACTGHETAFRRRRIMQSRSPPSPPPCLSSG